MSEGKNAVLKAIVLKNKPFRASQIFMETGLSRQLIRYHLEQFMAQGYVEKNGNYYNLLDKEKMLNELFEPKYKQERARTTLILTKPNVEKIHEWTNQIQQYRALDLPMSLELKQAWLEKLDESIKSLQQERRALMSHTPASMKSARQIRNYGEEKFLKKIKGYFEITDIQPPLMEDQWFVLLQQAIEKELDSE